MTSDIALQFAQSVVRRFDVDWAAAGFDDADLDELAEYLLRIIQSFVVDPGRPPAHRGGRVARLPATLGRSGAEAGVRDANTWIGIGKVARPAFPPTGGVATVTL